MPEYTLNINIDGGSEGKKSKAERSLGAFTNKNISQNELDSIIGSSGGPSPSKEQGKLHSVAGTSATVATAGVLDIAKTVATYKLTHYGSKYSYQTRQNLINNIFTTVQDVHKPVMSGVKGASIGAMAGPWGALIGAIIGSVVGTAKMAYDFYERNQVWVRQNHEYEIEQTRISERLGILASDRNRGR